MKEVSDLVSTFMNNKEVLKAKGNIPYWRIANKLGVHENTVRNWMKSEMEPGQKGLVLATIKELKENSEGLKVV